jgi:hypothetical protein
MCFHVERDQNPTAASHLLFTALAATKLAEITHATIGYGDTGSLLPSFIDFSHPGTSFLLFSPNTYAAEKLGFVQLPLHVGCNSPPHVGHGSLTACLPTPTVAAQWLPSPPPRRRLRHGSTTDARTQVMPGLHHDTGLPTPPPGPIPVSPRADPPSMCCPYCL